MNIDQALELLRSKDELISQPPRLPTEKEVVAAEKDLSFTFPNQYRKFMLQTSNVTYGIREPALILPDLQPYLCLRVMAEDGWETGVPRTFLAFCSDNGNYFTINQDGDIGYFDRDDSSHRILGGDFKDWILEDWLELED